MASSHRIRRIWYSLSPRVRDTVTRAAKTFVQAFVPAVLVALAGPVSIPVLASAVVAAGASALSVAWNTVVKPSLDSVVVVVDPGE